MKEIIINQIKIPYKEVSLEVILEKSASILKIDKKYIKEFKILKKSIDARHKPEIYFIYQIYIKTDLKINKKKYAGNKNVIIDNPPKKYAVKVKGKEVMENRPVVVGFGPGGIFCAYLLASLGYKPIVLERGECVENRIKDIDNFWNNGKLNPESNVQFGEGGAGTFSDGKLNTGVNDKFGRNHFILDTFHRFGADINITYDAKPHIGTDVLQKVVKNMREEIIRLGGEVMFNSKVTDFVINDNEICGVEVNNNQIIDTSVCVLAIGHSARDTFKILYDSNIKMTQKGFAVGIRIQHPQSVINKGQYGIEKDDLLPPADYKLTFKNDKGVNIYSFCMCPGGYVVNSSSEEGRIAINGMSYKDRAGENANSALISTISPDMIHGDNPMDSIAFQRSLEEKAYEAGGGLIPVQLYKDFKENKVSTDFGDVNPMFCGKYKFANLRTVLPEEINQGIIEAVEYYSKKIPGYNMDDAILAAIESRTSSPVRIERNEFMEASVCGLYPCGEGAGFAGGIMSAAIDGLKVAESIIAKYSCE